MNKGFILICLIFSFTQAFADDMYGIFMVVKGDVKIETSTKQVTPAKVGAKIKPTDTIISGADSRARIVMADRNVINISPDTKLVIEKYENNTATGKKDVQLNLLNGKVRNNVEQKYDGDKAKFVLKTPTAVAGIRGTEFLTSFNSQTNQTTIVTFKGEVGVSAPTGGPTQVVRRGEMSQVSEGKSPEAPKPVPAQDLQKMDKESSTNTSTVKEDTSKKEADKGDKKDKDGDKKDGDKKDASSDKKDGDKKDASSDKKDSGDKKDASSDKKDSGDKKDGGDKKDASADKKDGGDKKDASADKKDSGADKKDSAATDKKDSGDGKKSDVSDSGKKGDAPKGDAAKGDTAKGDAPKSDAPKGDAPKGDARQPASDSAGTAKGGDKAPAAAPAPTAGTPPPPAAPTMIERTDMDTGIAKQLPPPPGAAAPPPVIPPMAPPPPALPTSNPIVDQIVQKQFEKTHLNINVNTGN